MNKRHIKRLLIAAFLTLFSIAALNFLQPIINVNSMVNCIGFIGIGTYFYLLIRDVQSKKFDPNSSLAIKYSIVGAILILTHKTALSHYSGLKPMSIDIESIISIFCLSIAITFVFILLIIVLHLPELSIGDNSEDK